MQTVKEDIVSTAIVVSIGPVHSAWIHSPSWDAVFKPSRFPFFLAFVFYLFQTPSLQQTGPDVSHHTTQSDRIAVLSWDREAAWRETERERSVIPILPPKWPPQTARLTASSDSPSPRCCSTATTILLAIINSLGLSLFLLLQSSPLAIHGSQACSRIERFLSIINSRFWRVMRRVSSSIRGRIILRKQTWFEPDTNWYISRRRPKDQRTKWRNQGLALRGTRDRWTSHLSVSTTRTDEYNRMIALTYIQ